MEKYISTSELRNDKKTAIKFRVRYTKGDYGIPRGIYFTIQPVVLHHLSNGSVMESWSHRSGMDFLMKPLPRKSAKQEELIAKRLSPELMNLCRLYQEDKKEEIKSIITEISASL